MASKRAIRRREERKVKAIWCREKIKHQSIVTAYQHAKELHQVDGAAMNWFRCKTCGAYHVGHARPSDRSSQ